jgi:hypothetical protein
MSKVDAALYHARLGRRVFPTRNKQPLVRWGEAATTDEGWIRAAWAEHPDADPAWALPADIIAIDIDPRHGGAESVVGLELTHGDLPPTATHNTPSGGTHAFYRTATPVPNSAGRLAPGVDIRTAGGYVVLPADGNKYSVAVAGAALADAPDWLVKLAGPRIERAENRDDAVVELDLPVNLARAVEYLHRTEPAISGKGGNNHTFATAALVRDFGISEETCFETMYAAWNSRCVPPWSGDELRQIVANAYRYASRAAGAERAQTAENLASVKVPTPEPAAPSRFRPLRWAAIQAMKPPTWMFADTLPESGLAMVYGPWGTYKSFIAVDLSLSAALGRPWAGRNALRKYNVVYAAGEGVHGLKLRTAAWAEHNKSGPVENFSLVPAMPLFGQSEDLVAFADAVRPLSPDLIVVDTVAHAMAGLDENAAKDAGVFVARCIELRNAFNATVLLVHHTGKDENKGARGSTAFPGAVDTLFRVSKPRDKEAVVTMEKQKDGEVWKAPQGFRAVAIGGSLAFEPAAITQGGPAQQDGLRAATMRSIIADTPHALRTKELADEMANVLASGADARTHDALTESLSKWLQRASKLPEFADLVLHQGTSKADPTLWSLKGDNDAMGVPVQ